MAGSVGGCIQWTWGAQLSTHPTPIPLAGGKFMAPHPHFQWVAHPWTISWAPCTPLGGLTVGPPDNFCFSNCPTLFSAHWKPQIPTVPIAGLSETRLVGHQAVGVGGAFLPAPPSLSGLLCHMPSATRGTQRCVPTSATEVGFCLPVPVPGVSQPLFPSSSPACF